MLSRPPSAVLDGGHCIKEQEGEHHHIDGRPQEDVGPITVIALHSAIVDDNERCNKEAPECRSDGHVRSLAFARDLDIAEKQ